VVHSIEKLLQVEIHQPAVSFGDVLLRLVYRLLSTPPRSKTVAVFLVSPVDEGTPQGGPLSPSLSNLVLDDLDRELERRGHHFVRYATTVTFTWAANERDSERWRALRASSRTGSTSR
jgi:retron-type reverse transcriptase